MTAVIMAVLQAGAVPIAFVNFSSSPILAPAYIETAAAASGAAASGDEDAFADGLATLESMGPASHADGNDAAAEKPVHGSSAHLHPQTTPTCQVKFGDTSWTLRTACCSSCSLCNWLLLPSLFILA